MPQLCIRSKFLFNNPSTPICAVHILLRLGVTPLEKTDSSSSTLLLPEDINCQRCGFTPSQSIMQSFKNHAWLNVELCVRFEKDTGEAFPPHLTLNIVFIPFQYINSRLQILPV